MDQESAVQHRHLLAETYRKSLEMINSDSRVHRRVSCEIPSSFRDLENPVNTGLVETSVNNISEGGVAFRSNCFVPVRNRLHFQLNVPKQKPINVRIQPAWIIENPRISQFEIGARFVDLSTEDRYIIQSLIHPRTA